MTVRRRNSNSQNCIPRVFSTMNVVVDEEQDPIQVTDWDHLDRIVSEAGARARRQGILSIILLNYDNDNSLGLVVGGDETVLTFTYYDLKPPYYASQGRVEDGPAMMCHLLFHRRTEFRRKHVISYATGLIAVREFYESGGLPKAIEWVEV